MRETEAQISSGENAILDDRDGEAEWVTGSGYRVVICLERVCITSFEYRRITAKYGLLLSSSSGEAQMAS